MEQRDVTDTMPDEREVELFCHSHSEDKLEAEGHKSWSHLVTAPYCELPNANEEEDEWSSGTNWLAAAYGKEDGGMAFAESFLRPRHPMQLIEDAGEEEDE